VKRIIDRLLVATRIISKRGRWPGQSWIRGATERGVAASAPRPTLRWPGQRHLARVVRTPRSVLARVLQSLSD